MRRRCRTWGGLALVLVACGPVVDDGASSGDDNADTTTGTTDASTTRGTTPMPTSATDSTTTVGTSTIGTTDEPSDVDVATSDTPKLDLLVGCGDGTVDRDELCDGMDLQGLSCRALGYAGGDLLCTADCTLDTSLCFDDDTDPSTCGNEIIEPGEQCDGADLQGFDCESLGLGPGVLLCDPEMCTFDTAMCIPT